MTATPHYDFIIVGSGFGGSVAALRLVEKGYRVLVLERGSELQAKDFPRSNWNLKRWMWMPRLGFRGLFQMTFFRHVTVLSGVGVGGGSLVYASTHPTPKHGFFRAPSWAHMGDWERELAPHYETVRRMLGVTRTPFLTPPDRVLQKIARERGIERSFSSTEVAIYFGEPGVKVPDPYFGGSGPDRTGCDSCGGCMIGCRNNAKNTLDKNYLFLARKRGLELHPDTEVGAVRPRDEGGYRVEAKRGRFIGLRRKVTYTADNVILAGGVVGTVPLLLRMKDDPKGLPKLSPRVGSGIRTNSEALVGVLSPRTDVDLSRGIAIGSILETDEHSHIEPVRYPAGSGFFRVLMAPHVSGEHPLQRLFRLFTILLLHPVAVLRSLLIRDMAKQSAILLYMRTSESTLRLRKRWWGGIGTSREHGPAPVASMPEATDLAHAVGKELQGMPFSLMTETLFNIPTTAHILGGCCMGTSAAEGVIDAEHRVHGYDGLYVMDGSAVSANPGVNPSLTIAALAERAVSLIPDKRAAAATPRLASAN